ncbi:hypothetical protein GCM10022381_40950 [Leifsonia kafniensis]|uniref:DUF2510 domain-containing protein n=1 Tax=Leifsonia kafniensis TaxID=475957 RepID=A0ABP7L594_9MICO
MTAQPGYVAPAGWYIDPTTSLHLRWWSGLAWTEHVAPIPDVAAAPDEYSADAAALPHSSAGGIEAATAAAAATATATAVDGALPPPPVPRFAPVSSYGWEREESKSEVAPRWTLPVGHGPEFTALPSKWGSVSVWVISFSPWLSVVGFFALATLEGVRAPLWLQWTAFALPWLITLAAAQRDVKRLRIWGHRNIASWAWALLGAPAYLIARTVVLRRNTGIGSAPLWVWIANFLLVVGLVLFLVVVFAAVFASLYGTGFDGTQF